MAHSSAAPWFVLRTKGQHEQVACNDLRHRRITSYLPMRPLLRRRREGRVQAAVPLFPGYVFIQPQPEQFPCIRYVRGSCGLVMIGSTPAPMPSGELAAVRILVDSGVELAVNPHLLPGRQVQVIAGPFMGMRGVLARLKCQERLVLNTTLLNSSVSVEVDAGNVAPV